jgi:hypothetical protein
MTPSPLTYHTSSGMYTFLQWQCTCLKCYFYQFSAYVITVLKINNINITFYIILTNSTKINKNSLCKSKFTLCNPETGCILLLVTHFPWTNLATLSKFVQCVRKVTVHLGYGTFRFRPVLTFVNITSNTFYKCIVTFWMQICRKGLGIKLSGLRPVLTLLDITSNTFYKRTATFRTHCSIF